MTDLDQACIHELFELQAQRTPDAVAISCGNETLTYSQLDNAANCTAWFLKAQSVGPGSRVVIWAGHSVGLVVAMLGVLKSGGAYVPVNVDDPAIRFRHIVDDCDPSLIICDATTASRSTAAVGEMRTVPLESMLAVTRSDKTYFYPPSSRCDSGLTHADIAYIIYTSGSTGRPKGAIIEHRNLVNHTRWFNREFDLTPADKIVQRSPTHFDASAWELYSTLTSGAALWMIPQANRREPAALETLLTAGATILQCTPALLDLLLDREIFRSAKDLRRLFVGGDVLTYRAVERFEEQCAAAVVNLYGPTEATIDALSFNVAGGESGSSTVPIGFPIDGMEAWLIDSNGVECASGLTGELCLSGRGVGRGYLNDPDLTSARFSDVSPTGTGRTYRTGDLARQLPNGAFEFVGRLDHQIKIRGYRVDPSEIETCLKDLEAISDAVVLLRENDTASRQLVAIVTGHGALNAADLLHLRAELAERLPAYMVPHHFEVLDTMPLTPSQKIDRATLCEVYGRVTSFRPKYLHNGHLDQLWGDVLGYADPRPDDDFFQKGGDSLQALILAHRIYITHGVELTLADLLDNPTLEAVTAIVYAPVD